MKVLDLINHLEYFDDQADVIINCDCCDGYHTKIYGNISGWERTRKHQNLVIVTVGLGNSDLDHTQKDTAQ